VANHRRLPRIIWQGAVELVAQALRRMVTVWSGLRTPQPAPSATGHCQAIT